MQTQEELAPFELRDPSALITEVISRVDPSAGDLVLALVRHASREQEIVQIAHYRPPDWAGYDDLSRFFYDAAQKLPVPPWPHERRGPEHSIVTVVVRRGFAVLGPCDAPWLTAGFYSNHGQCAFSSDYFLLTEHGWTEQMSGLAGSSPRLMN